MIRQNAPGQPPRMKAMTRTQLPVQLDGITDYWATMARIEVAFAQDRTAEPCKTAVWLPDGTGEITRKDDVIYIPWTRAETARLREGAPFYMDIRPVLTSGDDLTVEPLELILTWSLFEEAPL